MISQVGYESLSFKTQDATPTKAGLHLNEDENRNVVRPWHWSSLAPNPSPTGVPTVLFSSLILTFVLPFALVHLYFYIVFCGVCCLLYLSKLVSRLILYSTLGYPPSFQTSHIWSVAFFFFWHQFQWEKKIEGLFPIKKKRFTKNYLAFLNSLYYYLYYYIT